ncbi:hypothetical protein QQ056_17555 [Oscillatoria laete-virens NRMC-F 0139]|nr:hypothetical protein [Oscillatoria laete-virens]MDL5055341.1 hypothetical protein [Oscillatoria laete-virens NRMC-F 0139]
MSQQNLNINIKTKADTAGATATQKGLAGIKKQISELIQQIPLIGRLFTAMGGGVPVIGAVVAGFGALAVGIKKAVQEYAAAQEKIAKLDAALAQQGNLTKQYRIELQDLATQMQKTTGIADDEWYGVFETLTKLGGAGPENIRETTEAVKNLSAALDVDLKTASTLVSKAMQGNFDMFTRYGIIVDKTGTQTERLDRLFMQLAQRGGGILEARSKTLNGQIKQLSNNWSDFLEAFGRTEAKASLVQRGIESVSYALEFYASKFGGPIDQAGELANKHRVLTDSAEQTEQAVKSLSSRFDDQRTSSDKLAASLEKQKRSMRELQRQQDEMDDATMALEIEETETKAQKKIRDIQASGMTDEQKRAQIEIVEADKLKATSTIRRDYEVKKFEREQEFARLEAEENQKQMEQLDERSASRPGLVKEQEERLQRAGEFDEREGVLIAEIRKLEKQLKTPIRTRGRVSASLQRKIQEDIAKAQQRKMDVEDELMQVQSERGKSGIKATATEAQKLDALKAKTEQERVADESLYQQLLDENVRLKAQIEHREKIQAVRTKTASLSDSRQITQAQDKSIEQAKVAVQSRAKDIRMEDGKETIEEVTGSFTQAFAQLGPELGQEMAHAIYPILQKMILDTKEELRSQMKNQRGSMP